RGERAAAGGALAVRVADRRRHQVLVDLAVAVVVLLVAGLAALELALVLAAVRVVERRQVPVAGGARADHAAAATVAHRDRVRRRADVAALAAVLRVVVEIEAVDRVAVAVLIDGVALLHLREHRAGALHLAADAGHGAQLADAEVAARAAASAGRHVLVEGAVAVVVLPVAGLVRAGHPPLALDRAVPAGGDPGDAVALVGAADEAGARAALVGLAVAVVVEGVARLLHRQHGAAAADDPPAHALGGPGRALADVGAAVEPLALEVALVDRAVAVVVEPVALLDAAHRASVAAGAAVARHAGVGQRAGVAAGPAVAGRRRVDAGDAVAVALAAGAGNAGGGE